MYPTVLPGSASSNIPEKFRNPRAGYKRQMRQEVKREGNGVLSAKRQGKDYWPERFGVREFRSPTGRLYPNAETSRKQTRVHASQEQMDREMIRLDAPRSSAGSSLPLDQMVKKRETPRTKAKLP